MKPKLGICTLIVSIVGLMSGGLSSSLYWHHAYPRPTLTILSYRAIMRLKESHSLHYRELHELNEKRLPAFVESHLSKQLASFDVPPRYIVVPERESLDDPFESFSVYFFSGQPWREVPKDMHPAALNLMAAQLKGTRLDDFPR